MMKPDPEPIKYEYLPKFTNDIKYLDNNTEIYIRHNFILKVYTILSLQLFVTFGMVSLFMFVDTIKTYVQTNPFTLILAFVFSFIFLIVLICCRELARTKPINYIILSLFTLTEGYLLGTISSTYDTNSVMYALLITLCVTFGLTLFAMQTKIDFTGFGSYLLGALIAIIIFSIIASIMCTASTCYALDMIISGMGALLFSIYIIKDTQSIIGGNHKYSFTEDDYIFAAISLYLDIINLFLYILDLIKKRD